MKKYFLLFACAVSILCCDEENSFVTKNEVPNLNKEYSYSKLELPFGIDQFSNKFSNQFINSTGIVKPDLPNNELAQLPAQKVKVSDAGAQLGRVLFYDKKLSINNAISCGSCHHQDKAFTDGQATSLGFKGLKTTRSSMAIVNPITQNNLFWDSRSHTIHDLTLLPVQNHIEMGMEDLEYLEKKLAETSYYKTLFKKAFNSEVITKERISEAMAQFIGSITSNNSKFDTELRSTSNTSSLSPLEQHGRNLFFGNKALCSSCHSGNNFSAADGENDVYGGASLGGVNLRGTTNIGLDFISKDKGKDNGNFKIPTLRNIAVTGPYMHDGRFATLEQVVDHYVSGIKANPNLDVKFKDNKGNPKGLDLNAYDKKALVAFMNTLTDNKFLTDPKYSDPFKN
jgi:cytochrome c peroxidase